MTRIIPRNRIRHLEWRPEDGVPKPSAEDRIPQPKTAQQRAMSIDALINKGKEFSSFEKDDSGNDIGLAVALQDAYNQMGHNATVASLPYLIAGKAMADKSKYLWRNVFHVLTEENAGIDRNGKLVGRGQGIVLTIHGGGILTPKRIRQAYSESLTPYAFAKYTDEEFDNLLRGELPSGESIDLYTVDEVMQGRIPDPFGRYGVWMTKEAAKSTLSNFLSKSDFMNNGLVIARVGTPEYLEEYFEKAKNQDGNIVGNWHMFYDIDFRQPQGTVLLVDNSWSGIDGIASLKSYGQFVAVAPEDVR